MEDQVPTQAQAEWEEDLAKRVEEGSRIPITEKRQVILARRGQGKFRERVLNTRAGSLRQSDHGFISFENNGDVLVSPVAHRESLKRMGIEVAGRGNAGASSDGQRRYLEFHREAVFLEARTHRPMSTI
jgi:hypothetical protein